MATTNGFPTGTYTTTIVAGDIPSAASAEERAGLAGPWEVAFGGNGHALVTYNGQQVVDATYSLSGRDLTLGEDTGEYACHSPARYTWHAAGGELHLTPVADTCVGRQTVLSAHPLVRR
jgi:hypothetical protein